MVLTMQLDMKQNMNFVKIMIDYSLAKAINA